MLGLVYLHYKFPPSEGGLTMVLFLSLAILNTLGALLATWILVTRWPRLSISQRALFMFYAVFL
jgi:hypothetical protein